MTIRNAVLSMIVAVTAVSVPVVHAAEGAAPAASVEAAYSHYEREAGRLDFELDRIGAELKEAGTKLSADDARRQQLSIDLYRARHDAALGRLLAESARAQAKQQP